MPSGKWRSGGGGQASNSNRQRPRPSARGAAPRGPQLLRLTADRGPPGRRPPADGGPLGKTLSGLRGGSACSHHRRSLGSTMRCIYNAARCTCHAHKRQHAMPARRARVRRHIDTSAGAAEGCEWRGGSEFANFPPRTFCNRLTEVKCLWSKLEVRPLPTAANVRSQVSRMDTTLAVRPSHSPSPFSPATRLNSLILVVATGAPHSRSPESAETSPSSWLEWMNKESVWTDWNLTKRNSMREPSCSKESSSSCSAGRLSASSKPRALQLTKSLTPLGARPSSGPSICNEWTFVVDLNATVISSCSSASL
mmetsp:Transcript_35315/g.112354  ORF Transcript_35315/g.112354 Transcript_35315/m.112354 type:complete len:309 (+) Transcript_35315:62-988(+)